MRGKAVKMSEKSRVWLYRHKENGKQITGISWDGPPSNAYQEFTSVAAYDQLAEELRQAKAEIERLQNEVVARNQYKINQEYLDNTHKYYEEELQAKDAEIERMRSGMYDRP